jgi:hypothetical protein
VKPTGDQLLVHSFAGDDWIDCQKYVRGKLGEIGLSPSRVRPVANTPEHTRQQRDKAEGFWLERKPLAGSIAERYLRQVRGYGGPLPATLGFLPPLKREHHPALIAAFGVPDEPEPGVLRAPCDVGAVHLTLLKPDGSGKAEIAKPKLVVGSPHGKPIVIASPNDLLGLTICEGIESGLSIYASTGLGVWVAGSAGRMPALAAVLPNYVECVTIYQEADHAGQQHAQKLARALVKLIEEDDEIGPREVRIAEAPP